MVKSTEDENNMWEHIENELSGIRVEDLNYDHPLCNGFCQSLFQRNMRKSQEKSLIPSDPTLKSLCERYFKNEKKEYLEKVPKKKRTCSLDDPEKLQDLTNEMLKVFGRIWRSSKWKFFK